MSVVATRILVIGVVLAGGAGGARAQFVTAGDDLSKPAEQNVEETETRGRLSTSIGYYDESDPDPGGQGGSPDTLLWGDLRARVEAYHIKGSAWDALGDFRIRYTPDGDFDLEPKQNAEQNEGQKTARGWIGGNELDLREAFLVRRSDDKKKSFAVGRMILRDVDAMTIDGVAVSARKGARFEYGLGLGMFPNPYSRSLDTDYALPVADTRTITQYPVGAGTWLGYRTTRFYGAFGLGAIVPRNNQTAAGVEDEPIRSFVSTRGYGRISPLINVFHYGVFDFTGAAGANLTNLQLGLTWRAKPRLTLDLAYSHMSTYAIESFLRDLLEPPGPAGATSPINNLDVARVASDEVRGGANYSMLEKRIDVFGQVRVRRRDAVTTPLLDATIAGVPAEQQVDVSAGVRKKKALKGADLGANAAYLTGDRTKSLYVLGRANRTFMDDRLDVEVDAGYISYQDTCAFMGGVAETLTCTGTAKGTTIRGGFSLVYRRSEKWLVLGDYHYATNAGTQAGVARPGIVSHSGMLRAQYSF